MSIIVSQIFKLFLGEPHEHNEETGQVSFDCPACAEDKGLPHGQGDGKHKLAINSVGCVTTKTTCMVKYPN